MKSNCNKVAGPLPEFLLKNTPAQMFFCNFCEISKNTFFTGSLWVTTSGSSGCYLKTYQNDINCVSNSEFNANTECDNIGSCHPE